MILWAAFVLCAKTLRHSGRVGKWVTALDVARFFHRQYTFFIEKCERFCWVRPNDVLDLFANLDGQDRPALSTLF